MSSSPTRLSAVAEVVDGHSLATRPRRHSTLRILRCRWLRLMRADASPHALALGVAAGIFAAFVPVLGIQMALAAALAWGLRANISGALAGTFVGTPLTYPAMWFGSYELGKWVLGLDRAAQAAGLAAGLGPKGDASAQALDVLKPLMLGGVLLGLAASLAAYYSLRVVVARVQRNRRRRLVRA